MWLRQSRAAGSIREIVCTAIGLVLCAALLPGTTIDWQGVVIATAVIDLPLIAMDRYVLRAAGKYGHPRHMGRAAVALALGFVWVFGGLAIADLVTLHFNIGGVWQYVVLWLVIVGLGFASWKVITATTHDPDQH